MKFLPENFLSSSLSAVDARTLDYFYEQFVIRNAHIYGKGHLILAYYAALPAVLTPDLLYKIWLNFKNYSLNGEPAVIHPVAPADILLSPLVEEIGYELYEMPEQIRKVLLLYLKDLTSGNNEMQLFGLDTIAEFLKDYINYDFTPENKDDDAFREAQEWTALSYINPGKAFSDVARAFQQSKTNAARARYKDAIEKMSARFALNIVKDEAAIPRDFKAMTALTSVVRDVLKEGDSEGLQQLREEALKTKDLLTSVPIKAPNIINIDIPEKVGRKIIEGQKTISENRGRLKALIVGVTAQNATADQNNVDSQSAKLLYDSLVVATTDHQTEFNMLIGEQATRNAILTAWKELLTDIDPQDNLLFYLAANAVSSEGHCRAICSNGANTSGDNNSLITDQEIGDLTRDIECASITFILQLDHAATPYWLDIKKTQNIIFASCRYDQSPIFSNKETEGGNFCMFTYCLAETIKKKGVELTNRHLFAETMISYANNESVTTSQIKSPQLLCHPEVYDRFFLKGNRNTAMLQNLLRQTGYCDEKTTDKWNSLTAYALTLYCKENSIQNNLSKQDYIDSLLNYKQTKTENDLPIFLLLFSDPNKQLPEVVHERKMIIEALSSMDDLVELIILDDPSKKDLQNVLRDKKNRNRVQLFHYSGKDDKGYMVLKDGTFNLEEIAAMLDFQENIKLFFANTCWAQVFASHLTQLGVAYAIGTSGVINDDSAAAFANSIFELLDEGKDIRQFPDFSETNTNGDYKLLKAAWLPADSKLIWDFQSTSTRVEIFCIIIAVDEYRYLGKRRGAVEDAMLFASWVKEQTKADNCIIITQVGNQNDIDDAIEQILSLGSRSNSQEKKLIMYINGMGINGGNPVFYLPDISETRRNSSLNIEAYVSVITDSGIFNKVILFYDLLHTSLPGVQGQSPLFVPALSSPKTESVSIGYFLPPNAPYEKGMNIESRESLTKSLLKGLNGAAADEKGNITGKSLNYFMKNIEPEVISVLSGSVNSILATGKSLPGLSVLLKFSDQDLNKVFNLLDEKLNKINSVVLNQSSLEFELKPGIYIAEIPEAEVRKIFSVQVSVEKNVIDLSWTFRNKWIGIIGSGNDLTQEETQAAASIGIFLAEQGYGLVTGGWPGVDYLTGESFYNTLRLKGIEKIDDYLIQIVKTSQKPDFKKGQTLEVDEKVWEDSVILKCFALISIGGRGYTYEMFERAQKLNYPFIPLPYTGGDSGKIYQELSDAKQSSIPELLIEQLGKIKTTDENCITLLAEILNQISVKKSGYKWRIFMSYSQNDLSKASRITEYLKQQGENVFFAAKDLFENKNYAQQKQQDLLDSDYCIVILSPRSIISRHVTNEVRIAIEHRKKIIPVIIDDCEIPDNLRSLSAIDMRIDEEQGLRRISHALHPQTPDPEFSEKEIEVFYKKEIRRISEKFNLSEKTTEDLQLVIESEFIADDKRILIPKNKLLDSWKNKGIREGDEILDALSQSKIVKHTNLNDTEFWELAHDHFIKVVKEAGNRREKMQEIFDNNGFYTDYGIRSLVKKSGEANESNDVISMLLIFETASQHTWIAFTRLRAYMILDDANTRGKNRLIQTSFNKSKTLPLAFRDSKKEEKVLKFSAQDTWWYYSAKLFPTPKSLTQALENLLITILWVDQMPDDNRAERDSLSKFGYKFEFALTKNEAIEKLQSNTYCTIISGMARSEGINEDYTFLERLRSRNSITPFFIYAGEKSHEYREEALRRGAQGTPSNTQELVGLMIEFVSA